MRTAVIDLGTNTFNLLIAEHSKGRYTIIYQEKFPVKLGEGGINQKVIQPIPFWRGMDAIEKMLRYTKQYEVHDVKAFATSAVRSANNGKLFTSTIKKLFNLKVHIISGNREAELIYEGVKMALELNKSLSLIMDIGGGSTEFIIANDEKTFWKKSYKLGAARLLEKFNPSNPITTNEISVMESYLKKQLKTLDNAIQKYPISELIGSSGSFDTFAEMIGYQINQPDLLQGKTTYNFPLNELEKINELLLVSTSKSRLSINGLIAMRADMIVIASIFTHLIINKFQIKTIRLSTYSLKEGVINELINQ